MPKDPGSVLEGPDLVRSRTQSLSAQAPLRIIYDFIQLLVCFATTGYTGYNIAYWSTSADHHHCRSENRNFAVPLLYHQFL
ncbi:hypothetical protein EVAR_90852_1 [Eumeta japonica]|uniref:Uncharacterized protein n=1 Tax=Eumeta variegata TaxID=151549 RepID=A0A4C1ZXM9_EUMVA|nr:hypothetical protein EVAR_90852_1 [Eumeta japonica]